MTHEHPVVDVDKQFIIDPVTRVVKNAESVKTVLVQNDHNSERLTFEVDRYVEGHDMLESANVRIHYDNVGTNRLKTSGVYEVDDIQPSPDDSTKVIFTWLVSQNATSLVGVLNFSITFECEADGIVVYRWSTVLNTTDVVISEGLDNSGVVGNTYADILTKWKNELYSIVYTYPTFAEVCRWEDDNLDNEDRIGYFVTVDASDITEETLMTKATAVSEIRGVTMESPGFAANAGDYKFDENGELLPQYDYVGFSGFIPVIDNGLCSVNGWCKPGDSGTAVPTTDSSGYRVIERVDDTHVLILVEPQGAISTLIEKDTEIVNALANHANDSNNPHGVTAEQVGAIPIIDASGSSYDMNTILTSGTHLAIYETNSSTLNTPYASGLTTFARAKILSFAVGTSYGFQMALISGGRIPFMRRLSNGTIYDWGVGYTASDIGAMPDKTDIELRQSVNYLGVNPIATPEDDTTANWVALGSGWAYINGSDILQNQPTTYGFVENIVGGSLCYQVWHSMNTSGTMWHRSGNSSGWYDSEDIWFQLAEKSTSNIATYTSLDQLGLTDDDFVADDIDTNMYTLLSNMAIAGQLTIRGSTSNLYLSIKSRMNSDLGMSLSDSAIVGIHLTKFGTAATPSKLEVVFDSSTTKKIWIARIDVLSGVATVEPFIELYNSNGFLPLTGGTLSGNLNINDDQGNLLASSTYLVLRSKVDDDNNRRLIVYNGTHTTYSGVEKAFQVAETVDSDSKAYIIYGAHNVTAGTTDLTAGSSELLSACYYDVYK